MTDRELLELAAKAAGVPPDLMVYGHGQELHEWNPLEDDGEALRLAVKLHLCLLWPMQGEKYAKVGAGEVASPRMPEFEPLDGCDEAAATRRAIVRAAAEIGRQA